MADKKAKLESKAKKFIKQEYVIWLTTIGSDLAPQPRPVWFIWDKDSFLIFSQPHAHKLKHIKQHPNVSLHFNTDKTGDQDVIVYVGTARIDAAVPPAYKVRAYMKKYKSGIQDLGATPEQFSGEYSVAIRVTPTTLRGW
ncbi:MAG: TIGR03667 family PPOX class F420-dependent oxidoreductase [Anaerolineae bacterium]|nr:TIGR03667 family PPOX class F420-dependent oxidoreductase [Anaerolineae bacterium]MCI0608957.1 TIGR03667 family PPOX class F420-dependent oxidoreductase [Anaerolineae bacterium]